MIKKELGSLHAYSRSPTTIFNFDYIPKIASLLRDLDIKECMIIRLLNTMKEISS